MKELIREVLKEELDWLINTHRQALQEESKQIFENSEFITALKDELLKITAEEVRIEIRKADLHRMAGELVKEKVNNNLRETIRAVVEDIMRKMQRDLSRDYKIVKKMVYSVDAELRHLACDNGLSLVTEELIRDHIKLVSDKLMGDEKLLLEVKK